ncbi:MAG: hypothetical protein MRY74_13960 [Neomegalonema sp.]|nr:hypothetical protein [Neomegalonema sp.]
MRKRDQIWRPLVGSGVACLLALSAAGDAQAQADAEAHDLTGSYADLSGGYTFTFTRRAPGTFRVESRSKAGLRVSDLIRPLNLRRLSALGGVGCARLVGKNHAICAAAAPTACAIMGPPPKYFGATCETLVRAARGQGPLTPIAPSAHGLALTARAIAAGAEAADSFDLTVSSSFRAAEDGVSWAEGRISHLARVGLLTQWRRLRPPRFYPGGVVLIRFSGPHIVLFNARDCRIKRDRAAAAHGAERAALVKGCVARLRARIKEYGVGSAWFRERLLTRRR